MAMRTFAHDITVGEELVSFLIIVLLTLLLYEFAFAVEFLKEVTSQFIMRITGGTAVDIERDTKLLETVFNHGMIAVHHILRCDALFLGTDGDRHTVLITATNKYHFLFLQTEVSYVDISRNIHTGQVTNMYTAISIRQCSRHRSAFKLLFFHCLYFF